jgi:hypothetical protein
VGGPTAEIRRRHSGATAAGNRRRRRFEWLASPDRSQQVEHFFLLRRRTNQSGSLSNRREKVAILGFSIPRSGGFRRFPVTPGLSDCFPSSPMMPPGISSPPSGCNRRRRPPLPSPFDFRPTVLVLLFFILPTADLGGDGVGVHGGDEAATDEPLPFSGSGGSSISGRTTRFR